MTDRPNPPQLGLEDEAAFEASLAAGLPPAFDAPHTPPPDDAGAGTSAVDGEAGTESHTFVALPAAHQPAWVGKMLGHFKLLRPLGQGVTGIVIQARDVNLQRIVALKVLRKRIAGVDEAQRVPQFLREARAAAAIEHPNVVRIHEINQHNGWWYIAMEMIEGETLRGVVRVMGALSPGRACPLIADAASALAAAHQVGIVHRDVKPTNLMITRNGRCKVTDFGLVRLGDPDDPLDFTDKAVGTPQYMAPELIARGPITPAADVYSLGGTLYFALTGHPPYTAPSVPELVRRHQHDPPPDPRDHAPDCPESLANLVKQMMAKDPARRPAAADVVTALRAEGIVWRDEESSVSYPGATGFLTHTAAAPEASTVHLPTSLLTEQPKRRPLRRVVGHWITWTLLGILTGVALAMFLVPALRPGGAPWPGDEEQALARRFPNAPETYGTRGPGELPIDPADPAERPPAPAEPPPAPGERHRPPRVTPANPSDGLPTPPPPPP